MIGNFISRHQLVIIYGIALAMLAFLLKWLELRFIIISHAFEIYIGAIAILFTALGIWLATKLIKPKLETIVVEKAVYITQLNQFVRNEKQLLELGLSKRELEVLQLMADGLSNQEIAAHLYVSLNTIKTHASRLFEKLEVKRRTQAVEKGKKLQIIP
ncbi:MAG: LuxR C-terminal-related transcriptional regulator [Bacteroidota bacterium]